MGGERLDDVGRPRRDRVLHVEGRERVGIAQDATHVLVTGDHPVVDRGVVEHGLGSSPSGEERIRVVQVRRREEVDAGRPRHRTAGGPPPDASPPVAAVPLLASADSASAACEANLRNVVD